MTEHVSEDDLLLAFDGELSPERNEAVRSHTRACAACEGRWVNLTNLSGQIASLQGPELSFRPEEEAVANLGSRLDQSGAEKKLHWTARSLVFANTLAAAAVAITCLMLWPGSQMARNARLSHAVAHAPIVYDLEQAVPPGYVSLPYADPALPLDDAAVLPVELSAEDLELMGFDANETPQDGVRAELLIGMDGWPRAIRIIEQF